MHRIAVQIRGAEFVSLRGQMIRAGFSIPANIVEGSGQDGAKQYARFVRFSVNSTTELEYHLIAARDVRVMTATEFDSLSEQTVEVRKMLYGLLRYLDRSKGDPAAPKSRV